MCQNPQKVAYNFIENARNHCEPILDADPPANKATFPTDVAAKFPRATLSRAVDHVLVALLYTSTALEGLPAAQ